MPLILIIEDDPTQRLLASSILRSAGHDVLEATDGAQGLEMAQAGLPDVVVCDVMMPGINGYQMVAALRNNPATADIPVLFLSAMKERSHIRLGMATGADDYLPKPFTANELKESVSSLLVKRARQRETSQQAAQEIVVAALQDQKQELSGQYELRLLRELNKRWQGEIQSDEGLHYPGAPVLAVDVLGPLLAHVPQGTGFARAVKRLYVAASDALYLFGARHLQPFGCHMVAIFANEVRPDPQRLKFQALRAAFAVQRGLRATIDSISGAPLPDSEARTLTAISLHQGPITLMGVGDPLHGGADATLITGEGLYSVIALNAHARAAGWPVTCSDRFSADIPELLVLGGRAQLPQGLNHPPLQALELVAPGSATP